MKKLQLYPNVTVASQDFSDAPVLTVPRQSMSLQEIIRRYIRHLPVPVSSQEGFYMEGQGDLEKMQHADLIDIQERMLRETEAYKARKTSKGKVESPSVQPPPPVQPPQPPPGTQPPPPGTPPTSTTGGT